MMWLRELLFSQKVYYFGELKLIKCHSCIQNDIYIYIPRNHFQNYYILCAFSSKY